MKADLITRALVGAIVCVGLLCLLRQLWFFWRHE